VERTRARCCLKPLGYDAISATWWKGRGRISTCTLSNGWSACSGDAMERPAISYIRVSTSRQGRSGLGIEAQREVVRIERHGQQQGAPLQNWIGGQMHFAADGKSAMIGIERKSKVQKNQWSADLDLGSVL
jgi:hypothetical protein